EPSSAAEDVAPTTSAPDGIPAVPGQSPFVAMHRSPPPRSSHTLGRSAGSAARWSAAARQAAPTPTLTPPGATPRIGPSVTIFGFRIGRWPGELEESVPLVARRLPSAAPEQPSGQQVLDLSRLGNPQQMHGHAVHDR